MNKSILLGRLTRNPEIRFSQTNNTKIATFTLAVNRKYVKIGEERQADFINIVAYSKLADFVEKYLNQGTQICVSGRIQSRNWDDENGNRHYITEIIAEEISFAGSLKKPDENTSYSSLCNNIQEIENTDNNTISDDDLPF